ncbi:MAG: hypothetical protein K2X91_12035 [Thermoleophilia bacterium]|nr:hypothetical protein [Thermoleophilia bacterium]
MNATWLLRMARWMRHPPSPRSVALGLGVLGLCLALFGAERLGILPDWFAVDPRGAKP